MSLKIVGLPSKPILGVPFCGFRNHVSPMRVWRLFESAIMDDCFRILKWISRHSHYRIVPVITEIRESSTSVLLKCLETYIPSHGITKIMATDLARFSEPVVRNRWLGKFPYFPGTAYFSGYRTCLGRDASIEKHQKSKPQHRCISSVMISMLLLFNKKSNHLPHPPPLI